MTVEILGGSCLKCGTPTTNVADGRQRPFCHDCEKSFNQTIASGKIGKKYKKGKLVFPPANPEEEE